MPKGSFLLIIALSGMSRSFRKRVDKHQTQRYTLHNILKKGAGQRLCTNLFTAIPSSASESFRFRRACVAVPLIQYDLRIVLFKRTDGAGRIIFRPALLFFFRKEADDMPEQSVPRRDEAEPYQQTATNIRKHKGERYERNRQNCSGRVQRRN